MERVMGSTHCWTKLVPCFLYLKLTGAGRRDFIFLYIASHLMSSVVAGLC